MQGLWKEGFVNAQVYSTEEVRHSNLSLLRGKGRFFGERGVGGGEGGRDIRVIVQRREYQGGEVQPVLGLSNCS